MNKITKQCVAAVASLAMAGTLCVAGAVVAGSSAWAEGTTPCTANTAPWDQQNKQCVGSIEIDKYKDELNNQGKQAKQTGVAGAKFKVTPVNKINSTNIDLKQYDDWLKVAAKVSALNANPSSLSDGDLGTAVKNPNASESETDKTLFTTGSDGKITISNLPIGLYKVEEVAAAENYSNDVAPFFMTVPEITRADDAKKNAYKYDVKVEPKNAYIKDNVTKTADTTKTVGSGDEITYTIKAKLNKTKATNGNDLTKDDLLDFAIYDDVQTAAYQNVSGAIINEVKINGEQSAMAKDTYTVSHEDGNGMNGIENGRTRYKVTFNDKGLKAIAAKANTLNTKPVEIDVTVKFTLAKDLSSFIAKGLKNESGFIPGHGKGIDPKPTPGGSETTKFVKFQIKKVNGTDGKSPLAGAKFAIFANKDHADDCVKADDRTNCTGATANFVNAQNGTGADGIATGVTDGTAFEVKVTNSQQPFYVVETVAPKGFVLSPKVEKVVARNTADPASGSTDGGHYDADKVTFTYTFKDLPNGGPDGGDNWFKLPKTGAAGVIIFALIGLGLVGSGMFVFLKNRKKEEEQAA